MPRAMLVLSRRWRGVFVACSGGPGARAGVGDTAPCTTWDAGRPESIVVRGGVAPAIERGGSAQRKDIEAESGKAEVCASTSLDIPSELASNE